LQRNWTPLPVPFKSKNPAFTGWPRFAVTEDNLDQYFNGHPQNIGVLLGKPSRNLVDIDLDAFEALAVASHLAHPTKAIFGRLSKPKSHLLYEAESENEQFADPIAAKSQDEAERRTAMLCEIRSTGMQTIFPGSTHASGEAIRWFEDGEPSRVDAKMLRRSVARIAAGSILARYWRRGIRHKASLALAGGLLRAGWDKDEIVRFIEALCFAANDEETPSRTLNVETTARKLAAAEPVQGWPTLKEVIDERVVRCVTNWLEIHADVSRPEHPKTDTDLRVYRHSDLKHRCAELGQQQSLVAGLLPHRSLGLLVGDSGLGKSALLYQLGVCVAAGVDFLGRRTEPGRVLILDFENGLGQVSQMVEMIVRHLGLDGSPDELLLWNYNDCSASFGMKGNTALDIILEKLPKLTIIDSITSLYPEIEEKNSLATKAYQDFRRTMRESGTTILASHHIKKPNETHGYTPSSLEGTEIRKWFLQARGARALINGCDVRLGVDIPRSGGNACLEGEQRDEIALVMGGFARVDGVIPTTYIARVQNEAGEPQGYRSVDGVRLLFNQSQEEAFSKLPASFRFKDVQRVYGKGAQPTSDLLKKLVGLQLVVKTQAGYIKTEKALE